MLHHTVAAQSHFLFRAQGHLARVGEIKVPDKEGSDSSVTLATHVYPGLTNKDKIHKPGQVSQTRTGVTNHDRFLKQGQD